MNVAYWLPLKKAWDRMVTILFRPFDAGKWIVLAFVVWVARLLDGGRPGNGGGGHGGHGGGWGPGGRLPDADTILGGLREAWQSVVGGYHWLMGHAALAIVVFVVVPLILALILALIWLTSRFKLIYLDNVVWNRVAVVEPWQRLRRLGDSLFLFRVAFGLAGFVGAILLTGGFVGLGVYSLANRTVTGVMGLGFLAIIGVAYMIMWIYASLFLESFVVPIMYRLNVTVLQAWRTFLPYLSAYTVHFVLYGLFVLLLFAITGFAILVFGLATCCIGFFILWLPYVGTVILLPLLVTYRLFSLEFLAQIDHNLDLLAAAAQTQASAAQQSAE